MSIEFFSEYLLQGPVNIFYTGYHCDLALPGASFLLELIPEKYLFFYGSDSSNQRFFILQYGSSVARLDWQFSAQ